MISASTLLNAYVEVNAILGLVALSCWATTRLLAFTRLSHAVTAQLRFHRALLVAALASPVAVGLAATLAGGGWAPAQSINLTDFVVAQYLQGNITMRAADLESALTLRGRLLDAASSGAGRLFLGLVAVGALLALARLCQGALKLRRVLAESYLWRRIGSVELRVSDIVSVPFSTRTIRRRIIVVPSGLLAREQDLRIALGHELQHLREGDVEWEFALCLAAPLFFWNPAFSYLKGRIEELRELSCDARVLARRQFDMRSYCDCLIRVCHDGMRKRRFLALDVPGVALVRAERGVFGSSAARLLRKRMLSVVEARVEPHPTAIFVLLAAPLVTLTLLAALSIRPPADWSQDRIMLSTITNLERLDAINSRAPGFGVQGW